MGELMTIKNIGFIGLGAMGSVMAPLIVKSGCNVLGYDIKAKIDKSSGVKQVEDINEFSGLDVIIFMLPNGRIVSEMAIKLLEMNLKSVFIDMSSSDPRETQELGKKLKNKGIKFLDAPVSGGVARAKTGDLMIMAGGDEKFLEEVNDLLSVMGKVQFAGPLGSGHAIKALNNYLDRNKSALASLSRSLEGVSPLSTLDRGYSITFGPKLSPIKSTDSVKVGDKIRSHLHKGNIESVVSKIENL